MKNFSREEKKKGNLSADAIYYSRVKIASFLGITDGLVSQVPNTLATPVRAIIDTNFSPSSQRSVDRAGDDELAL